MENCHSLIAVSCVLSLLFLAWKVLNSAWLKPKRLEKFLRVQGFRGNPYRPLLGDLKELGEMLKEAQSKPISLTDDIVPRVVPFFAETIKKYGKNSFFWSGTIPSLLILDPELVKEIFLNYNSFLKYPPVNTITGLIHRGLISFEGEEWQKRRRIINPAFHRGKLKHMLPAFHLSVTEMLGKWEAIVSPQGSGELDVWPYIQTLTSDALSRTAFGSSYEEGRKIFEFQKEQLEHIMVLMRSFLLPGWRFLPTKRNRRMKYIRKVVSDSIGEIINRRLRAMKTGEASNDDLLGILLETNEEEIQIHGDKNSGMTVQEIIEECKLFYVAGHETTSSLLVWTLILLAVHQEWQSRAREEVLQQFGRNPPDFEGHNRLKVVTMILNETLRLYPAVAYVLRTIHEDTKLGAFSLPSGAVIILPFIFLNHDTKLWGDDAKEFKPERFAEGAQGGQAAFMPFGRGPRICIGMNFAMIQAKVAMAMILQNFSFELSPSYSHAPHATFTVLPQHGADLILHKL